MTGHGKYKENSESMPVEKDRPRSLLQRVKHLLGAGPHLLLLGIFIEILTVAIRRWISFPVSLTFEVQVILTIPCLSLCLLGMIWFHRSLNLIKVNLFHEQKKLITYGPFCYVRHPLYSILLLTIPPLLIIWLSDLLFIIPWIVIVILSHYVVSLEERELIKEFGKEYEKYRKHVPSLLPYKGAGGTHYREHMNESMDAV